MNKGFKKIIMIVSCVIIMLAIVPIMDMIDVDIADDFNIEANAATYSGKCGENLTWVYSGGTITISGTGSMYSYTFEGTSAAPWSDYKTSITKVVISNGVTSVGSYAFLYCTNLKTISIANTVTTLGYMSFAYCTSLMDFSLPDSITNLNSAFHNCGLYNSYSSGVVYIGDFAYDYIYSTYNTGTIDLVLNSDVKYISSSLFHSNSKIKSIVIDDSVVSIGDSAFNNCSSLVAVYYTGTKEQWAKIDIGSNNDSLNSASIIYNYAENKCGDNIKWSYNYSSKTLTITGTGEMWDWVNCYQTPWWDVSDEIEKIVIGDGITSIGENSFYYCTEVTSITIGDSVKTISTGAFQYCTSLASLTLPATVTKIESKAFYTCSNSFTVYYSGTSTQWNNISIYGYNTYLTSSTIKYATSISGDSGSTWIKLSWSKVSGATGYQIYMNGTKIATLYDGETSYTVKSLTGSTDYEFVIRSFSKGSSTVFGSYSSTFTFTTNPYKATFSSYSSTDDAIRVNWNKVDGADGYRIYQYINGSWVSLATVSSSTLTYRISDLNSGTTYKFKVKAYTRDVDGTAQFGVASDTYVTKTDATQVQMTSFSATTTAIRINWAKVDDADGYRIYQYINGSWVTVKTVSSSTLTYRIDDLKSDTIYKFKVKAYYVNSSGTTKWYDASDTFVTHTDYTQVQMRSYSATATAVRINWEEVETADGYRIYQYINGSWVKVATVSSSTLTYRISGLKADTTYKFKVKAYYKTSSGKTVWYDSSDTFVTSTD